MFYPYADGIKYYAKLHLGCFF